MPTFLRLGGTLSTTLPSMETCPESWVSSPATILSSVVLPEPLGPTILNNSPLSMLMFTSESTLLLPKLLLRPWIATLIRVSAHPFTGGGVQRLHSRLGAPVALEEGVHLVVEVWYELWICLGYVGWVGPCHLRSGVNRGYKLPLPSA